MNEPLKDKIVVIDGYPMFNEGHIREAVKWLKDEIEDIKKEKCPIFEEGGCYDMCWTDGRECKPITKEEAEELTKNSAQRKTLNAILEKIDQAFEDVVK